MPARPPTPHGARLPRVGGRAFFFRPEAIGLSAESARAVATAAAPHGQADYLRANARADVHEGLNVVIAGRAYPRAARKPEISTGRPLSFPTHHGYGAHGAALGRRGFLFGSLHGDFFYRAEAKPIDTNRSQSR